MIKSNKPRVPWIGVDLDGTLAFHDGTSVDPNHVGDPIPLMLKRVKEWIAQGITVKIFTARAEYPEMVTPIQDWCERNGLPRLEVTRQKDFQMVQLWDDRAIQVLPNTGLQFEPPSLVGK